MQKASREIDLAFAVVCTHGDARFHVAEVDLAGHVLHQRPQHRREVVDFANLGKQLVKANVSHDDGRTH